MNYCWTWFGIRCNHHQHQLWSSVEIWAQNQVENWCAFAPDFKEFDKNVEYEERESEIDIEDKDKSVDLSTETKHDEEIEVDVSKVDPIAAFCNSDEELDEEQCLQYIPMAPEVEEPDGWNSQDNSNDPDTGSNDADTDSAGPSSSKRRRTQTQTYDIQLEGVPAEGNFIFMS